MNKEQQIEEMAVIGCVRNPQAHIAEECAKCDFKQGCCNAYRHAEALYNVGYRKVSDSEAELQKLNIKYYNEAKDLRRELAKAEAENERLSAKLGQILLSIDTVKEMNAMCDIEDHRKQAVKEFAENLKGKLQDFGDGGEKGTYITEKDIYELLKEYENE